MELKQLSILAHSLIRALDNYDEDPNHDNFAIVQERNQNINLLLGNIDPHTVFKCSENLKSEIKNSTQQTFQSETDKAEGWKSKEDLIKLLDSASRRATHVFEHHEEMSNRLRM